MQLLSAGIGTSITETEEGPMSIWEALQQLRTSAKWSGGIVDGHHLHLDELRLKLPNWGATLENLASSYSGNLPKIGVKLNKLGACVLSLESRGPSANPTNTSFLNLGNAFGGGSGSGGAAYVPQTEFDSAKQEIQEAFELVKTSIENLEQGATGPGNGNGGTGTPANLQSSVDKRRSSDWMKSKGEPQANPFRYTVSRFVQEVKSPIGCLLRKSPLVVAFGICSALCAV
jgi:hypothetical protein